MKLYELFTKVEVGYDCYQGFIIRASSAKKAREIAQKNGADECDKYLGGGKEKPFWTDPKKTACREVKASGKEEVVLSDFVAG